MRKALLLLSCAAALAACDNAPPPSAPKPAAPKPADKPAEAKKDAAAGAAAGAAGTAPAASEAAPFTYAYIPSGKRDPFRNPLDEVANNPGGAVVVQTACTQPLCKWDLDQLKLVGVVSGMSNPIAMVEDPAGVGHLVRRNSFMGKKGGRVTQIKHDSVVITEISRGGDGKPHPNDIPLHLAPDASEKEMQDLLESEGSE